MFYFIFQISVLAKVVKEKTSAVQDVRGKLMNRKDIIIADSTASIKLALWDALVNQIQLEKSYLFKNVATRSYNRMNSTISRTVQCHEQYNSMNSTMV